MSPDKSMRASILDVAPCGAYLDVLVKFLRLKDISSMQALTSEMPPMSVDVLLHVAKRQLKF